MPETPSIVLIDPPGFSSGLNVGLGYLCGSLVAAGRRDITVLDFNNLADGASNRLACARGASYVGISLKTVTLRPGLEIVARIRELNPKALVVAGGPHVTVDALHCLKTHPGLDACLAGEGEEAIVRIVNGEDIDRIPGLYHRSGGKSGPPSSPCAIADLESLPFPQYHFFDSVMRKGIAVYPLVTSRGCPYRCTYCSVGLITGRRWRFRSAENVIAELEEARGRYGMQAFQVLDDNFTMQPDRAKEICRLLIARDSKLRWSCPNGIRADRLDEELLSLMKRAGCFSISLGVESLDPEIFDSIRKGERLEDVLNSIRLIKRAGIRVEGFFIIGLPGATFEKDLKTIFAARRLGLDNSAWGMLVPYPGTPVWEWVESNKGGSVRILKDWRNGSHVGIKPEPVFDTVDYPARQRIRAYRRAYLANATWPALVRAGRLVLRNLWREWLAE